MLLLKLEIFWRVTQEEYIHNVQTLKSLNIFIKFAPFVRQFKSSVAPNFPYLWKLSSTYWWHMLKILVLLKAFYSAVNQFKTVFVKSGLFLKRLGISLECCLIGWEESGKIVDFICVCVTLNFSSFMFLKFILALHFKLAISGNQKVRNYIEIKSYFVWCQKDRKQAFFSK